MIPVKKDGVCDVSQAEKQPLLAKKTLENLQLISMAEIILKEKFNGNPQSWIPALFEALSMKNSAYLVQEKNDNDAVNSLLSNKFDDSFWRDGDRNNLTSTSYQLVNCFKKFMSGLNENANLFQMENLLPDLKDIERNIHSYLNAFKQYDVKSKFGDHKIALDQTISSKEKDIVRKPDMSQICTECNSKIVILNNDIELSYQLHCQEKEHKKAVVKPAVKVASEQMTKIFEKKRSETDSFTSEDKAALRRTLSEKIKDHCRFIHILNKRDFHCNLCDCPISSLQNVISHVEGTKHTNNHKTLQIELKKSSDDFIKIDHSDIPIVKLI